MSVTVLIADDSDPFREAAANVVRATASFELLAQATSGEQAVSLAEALAPDLVLMDVRMPGAGGLAAASRIAESCPTTLIVLLSADELATSEEIPWDAVAAIMDKRDLRPRTLEAIWTGLADRRTPGVRQ